MPLFGASIPLGIAKQLSKLYKHVVVWLDDDKLGKAVELRGLLSLLFASVTVVTSEKDPKYQTLEQLQEKLGKPLDKRDQLRYNTN
jgi:hypothetical protein